MIKILIIEDDDVTNFISETKLNDLGFNDITIVTNGQMGIDYLKTNECPNIILLDINMPILDGWEFLEIKQNLGICPNVPIIITTSSGRPEDRLKASAFGDIFDYLEKPINFDLLHSLLLRLEKENLQC
ncbi:MULTISPECIES: response regulator [Zobellia]|uniref:response regulator n=1 Tax=Zobellia TaxID=112040 RepID=UPI001BFF0D2E|nr:MULTISPECIES: response regulator [Zobellia]MBT9190181.1 response regulator [Zobellia russellii]MBU2973916.1 response regulator [Zobellia sp. B3R18]MDO6821083.1 response regulator [Zobellia sp. 1_MG-2023]